MLNAVAAKKINNESFTHNLHTLSYTQAFHIPGNDETPLFNEMQGSGNTTVSTG